MYVLHFLELASYIQVVTMALCCISGTTQRTANFQLCLSTTEFFLINLVLIDTYSGFFFFARLLRNHSVHFWHILHNITYGFECLIIFSFNIFFL